MWGIIDETHYSFDYLTSFTLLTMSYFAYLTHTVRSESLGHHETPARQGSLAVVGEDALLVPSYQHCRTVEAAR